MLTQTNPLLSQDMANLAMFSVSHMQNMQAMGLVRFRNMDQLIAAVSQNYGISVPQIGASGDGNMMGGASLNAAAAVHMPGIGAQPVLPPGALSAEQVESQLMQNAGNCAASVKEQPSAAVPGVNTSTPPPDPKHGQVQKDPSSGTETKRGLFPKVAASKASKAKPATISQPPSSSLSTSSKPQVPPPQKNGPATVPQPQPTVSQTRGASAVPSAGQRAHSAKQPTPPPVFEPRQVKTTRERMNEIAAQKRGEDTGNYQYSYQSSTFTLPASEENWEEEEEYASPFKWHLPQQGLPVTQAPPPTDSHPPPAPTRHPSDSTDWRSDMTGAPDPANIKPTVLPPRQPQPAPPSTQKEVTDFMPSWVREPPKPVRPQPVESYQQPVNKPAPPPSVPGKVAWSEMASKAPKSAKPAVEATPGKKGAAKASAAATSKGAASKFASIVSMA